MPFNEVRSADEKNHPDPKAVLELYRSGLSTNNIAKQLGYHKSLISKIVKENGELRFRTLTDAERAVAVEKYNGGEAAPKIAEQLGVTSPAIYLALQKAGVPRRDPNGYSKEEAINHGFFDRIDMPDNAYWLGFLLTDGCVTKGGEIILSLQATDVDHLELWRTAVASKRRICLSERPKQFDRYNWICGNARFVIKSTHMAAALGRLGVIPAKTGRTTYPTDIPVGLEADFWRGAVDGDGWLCWVKSDERQQLVLGFTGDLPVVEAFQNFVVRHTPTKAQITRNHSLWKFQVTDSYAYTIARLLYQDSSVSLRRKQDVFLEAQRRRLTPDLKCLN